ncbi:hypothetical protein [Roseovarius Plymouth podovirus 1]|uniref:Uncharacterized protein n=2 Tax=Roseovarius Plymouth podovirus 1 TaxID=926474 RepID=K4Q522_9CAUD|nr:hypothetical protein HYO70_gp35 [Roseovarius Plymouth podovirus 1]CBW47028.1 hypothetical protein [Roseovarius sp. 217 phage 1]CBX87965.1 hypothetical protein [Roseovarius Plymouth podovirus 1]
MNHKNQTLYRAIDNQTTPLRFLHLSGESLTRDKNYSWIGTEDQFDRLCEIFEWDALSLVSAEIFK